MALFELLDINELQRLQDEFCAVAGVSAYCLDHDGTKITRISGDDRYLHSLQEKNAFERVQGKASLEDLAIEDLEGGCQVAALAITARGEKELYWIVFRPAEMSSAVYNNALDLLRDASVSFLQSRLQSFGAVAENIRNQAANEKVQRTMGMVQALAKIVQLLDSVEPVENIMNAWLDQVSRFLELDTSHLFKLQEDDKYMDIICEWRKKGMVSVFDKSSKLDTSSFLHTDKPIIVNSDQITYNENREISALGMKAVMIFPIKPQEGSSALLLSLNHRKPHCFDEEEITFAEDAVRVLHNILIRRIQKNSLISS